MLFGSSLILAWILAQRVGAWLAAEPSLTTDRRQHRDRNRQQLQRIHRIRTPRTLGMAYSSYGWLGSGQRSSNDLGEPSR
jgi:hypothetical protein